MNQKKKTALVTGVTGQDGFYLSEILIRNGYSVFGTSYQARKNHSHSNGIEIFNIDLTSNNEIKELIYYIRPQEVYNLAARASSSQLLDDPITTSEINGLAAVRLLETIRQVSPTTRFLQAASSELFAGCQASPQDEDTPYKPVNPYGVAKAYAANIVTSYRKNYGVYATTAILFNHESPRRGLDYVTRKITHAVAQIALGQAHELVLGDLDSRRDWGFASDYARGMWLMLQYPIPEDFVLATGEMHSVREFCEIAFAYVGLDYKNHVKINPAWSRRRDSIELCGNSTKARQLLGWKPSINFNELIHLMIDADLQLLTHNT